MFDLLLITHCFIVLLADGCLTPYGAGLADTGGEIKRPSGGSLTVSLVTSPGWSLSADSSSQTSWNETLRSTQLNQTAETPIDHNFPLCLLPRIMHGK